MERIDVHCHAVPPGYREYAITNGHDKPDGMPALPAWRAEEHIALMDRLNITRSILSISSPGTNLTPAPGDAGDVDSAATATRRANEELAAVCATHPARFSFFASLPLPDVAASLAEVDHALDALGAAGFVMLSNARGVYLGDPALDPVFRQLSARRTTVFVHPTTCQVLLPGGGGEGEPQPVRPLEQLPRPIIEFMFDETRAIANLLLSGTVERCPGITFVMSHCGCALPPILDRIGGFSAFWGEEDKSDDFRKLLRERFYFDLAGFPFPDQIHGLLRALGPAGEEKLVYGSDYPFTPVPVVEELAEKLDRGCAEVFNEKQRRALYSGNAERLFGFENSEQASMVSSP
ncbi:amidohydrolase [Xylariaceae sp. FL0804]|nr:amidohydrolase [Xylariaceae sp. FL0804]